MLSHHHQGEFDMWAAQSQSYPAFPSLDDSRSLSGERYSDSDSDNDSDIDKQSLFSRGAQSRRSSVTSLASDDDQAAPPVGFDQPRDFNGAPITMYASLDQAVAHSTQMAEAQGPRRLVTPGKLYENEEEDDEIVESGEQAWATTTTTMTTTT